MNFLKEMNLPNRLTLLRIVLIPLFLFFLLVPVFGVTVTRILSAILFLGIAITDMLDGQIARKYGLVTDFGKFLDPIADKLLVFGAFFGLMVFERGDALFLGLLAFCSFLTLAREFAVTGLRMVAVGKQDVVIAANIFGKVKTVGQIVFVMCALLEPVLIGQVLGLLHPFFETFASYRILTYASMLFSTVMAVGSGMNYFKAYFPLISENK